MYKKLILSTVLLFTTTVFLSAQTEKCRRPDGHHNCKCDTRVQKLDSLVNYRFDATDSSFTPAYVIKYNIDDKGNTLTAERINLPLRTPVYYQLYEYNDSGNISSYLYKEWKNEQWTDVIRTDYYYDENNYLIKEILHRKDVNLNWEAYQQHFYSYLDGKKISYLRQVKDASGTWNDISHHYYIYDSIGYLSVLYGKYIASGEIFWKMNYYYDDMGKGTERVLQTLKYNATLKKNVLTNVNHQTFSWDIYGDLHELMTDEWINNEWEFTNKHIYYYSLIQGKKVVLCHKGKPICVSVDAVKAHLEHGDVLGMCPGSTDNSYCCRCNEPQKPVNPYDNHKKDYTVYPVPFNSEINVCFASTENKYTIISLCTMNGQVVASEKTGGRTLVTFNIPKLPDGPYLLRLTGNHVVSVSTVIKMSHTTTMP
jgi:hypothetical protein